MLFIKTKIHLDESIYRAKFIVPNLPIFTKTCMPSEEANLGSHISENLQRIFLRLHRLTIFGTINRFMEMNYCLNENHKKSQFLSDIVEVVHSRPSVTPSRSYLFPCRKISQYCYLYIGYCSCKRNPGCKARLTKL